MIFKNNRLVHLQPYPLDYAAAPPGRAHRNLDGFSFPGRESIGCDEIKEEGGGIIGEQFDVQIVPADIAVCG